jgi:very-short-patch-repair endonuclease
MVRLIPNAQVGVIPLIFKGGARGGYMAYIYNRSDQKNLRKILRKNQPATERLLWSKLRNRQLLGLKFRRQYGIGSYITDFCCPEKMLVVEIDGDSHYINSEIQNIDRVRQTHIENLEFRVLRFTNLDITKNLDGVLATIAKHLTQ